MSVELAVSWSVTGQSTVTVTDDELQAAGLSEDKIEEVGGEEAFRLLNKHFDGDLGRELVDNWDEMSAAEVIQVDVSGSEGYFIG